MTKDAEDFIMSATDFQKYGEMNPVEFEFHPPPECPVFRPTVEEFKDPLGYIAKIRPIAVDTGICKIIPPSEWQPPFAVDVDNFRFTPRMQRLNELEATTRIKLNFLDQIAKFWELQGSPVKTYLRGSSLKIPNVERKALDLFTLYRVVHEEGGMEIVSRDRKWSRIATRMGYPVGRGVGTLLRQHYERILYPYDVFQSGASLGELKNFNDDSDDSEKRDRDYIPHGIPSRQAIKPPPDRYARRSKRHGNELDEQMDGIDYSTNSELKKLQFYGAGPKMPGYLAKGKFDTDEDSKLDSNDSYPLENKICPEIKENILPSSEVEKLGALLNKSRNKSPGKRSIEQIVCTLCNGGDDEASMLLCDGCDDSYHTFCLIPPLSEIPKGDWRCPRCVAEEVCKPQEAFGFEQAQREYTLQEFGEKADQFKCDYFNMPGHKVPCSTVEKEFWRIVNAVDEDVTVEYGADLHTIDHGSGFPNRKTKNLLPGDEEYVNSGWNLNNLPVLEGSVLRHINADISGMKIPWTYVGMCFATFCWHNEDHWSYSINYLHWGEPKTWYGVPGKKAENFEDAMRSVAPELFHAQPDLLHQLVTIMNPNLLINKNVPIFRTNQHAGEFVVTFPRSYHAGFNQGYNFAEAVNFAPSDWLAIGRICVSHYSQLHRFCVFSHDELICFMAENADKLDVNIASCTYLDMVKMIQIEKGQRRELLEWGVRDAELKTFESLPDDERQCEYCKTTCFLSSVTCSCTYERKIACIPHKNKLCSSCAPSEHILWYRYTLDELPKMMEKLKEKAQSYDKWCLKATKGLEAKDDDKMDLSEFKELIQEAEEFKFNQTETYGILVAAVEKGEKCSVIAQQLLSRKVRTRNRQSGDIKCPGRLTLKEFQLFKQQLSMLPCLINESKPIKELYETVLKFVRDAREAIRNESCDSNTIEKLIDTSLGLDIDLPEIPQLKQKLMQTLWIEEVKALLADPSQLGLDILRKLLEKGINLPPHRTVERVMAQLQELLMVGEKWEEKAKLCLQARPRFSATVLEDVLKDAGNMLAHLPNISLLRDALKKAKDWALKVHMLQNGQHSPYLDVLEYLIIKGKPIPVHLDQYKVIENQVEAAKAWRDKTARTFLKKNSSFSLLEVLSPRKEFGSSSISKNKKKKTKDSEDGYHEDFSFDVKFEEAQNPASIVAVFKMAQQHELEAIQQLRIKNCRKRLEDSPETRYCICNKPSSMCMLQCELCKDWFHANCVPPPKVSSQKKQHSNFSTSPLSQLSKEIKFLCPLCMRSRRPRLETILSLLLSLQKLPVRLPEGEALQCLTEQGMNWQDRARHALATDELAAALSKLTFFSQKLVEQAAREKTEKIISTELMKAASNPELKQHLQVVAPNAFGSLGNGASLALDQNQKSNVNTSPFNVKRDFTSLLNSDGKIPAVGAVQEIPTANVPTSMNVDLLAVKSNAVQSSSLDGNKNQETADISANYNLEHAYSSASKTASATLVPPASFNVPATTAASPRKHPRKSPLVARQMESPVLQLSDAAISQLEQLMVEGDLLEITLEETQHIWNILQATKLGKDSFSSVSPFCELVDDITAVKYIKKKKRRLDDKEIKLKPLKNKMKLPERDDEKQKKKKLKVGKHLFNNSLGENGKSKKLKLKNDGKKESGPHFKKGLKIGKPKLGCIEKMALKKIKKTTSTGKPIKKMHKLADNEPEDLCSASTCLRPIGVAVNWVQCDGGCEQWFHMLCVGLDVTQVSETEDYICPYCSSKNLLESESLSLRPVKSEPIEDDEEEMVYEKTDSSIISNSGTAHCLLASSADDSVNEVFTPENSESVDSVESHSNSEKISDKSLVLSFDNCSFDTEKDPSINVEPGIKAFDEQESDMQLVQ